MVLSIVASELSHVCTKPLDFVCDSEAREVMNKVKDLEEEMVRPGQLFQVSPIVMCAL